MRLSKTIKAAIIDAALDKAGIPAREMATRAKYAEWAEKVRVSALPAGLDGAIKAARAASDAVPERFRSYAFTPHAREFIRVNIGGFGRVIYWDGRDTYSELPRRVTPSDPVVIAGGAPLAAALYAIDAEAEKVAKDREQITASVRAVLDSVPTVAQLINVWPEAVAFIPAAEKASAPQLPALCVAELNKLVGLP